MPKLDITHIQDRLARRIEELENGAALEARDVNALLTPEQQQELKEAWGKQQELRKVQKKPPKTDEDKMRLGWKTIREVRLEVLRKALQEASDGLLSGLLEKERKRMVKGSRIYLDAYFEASGAGKNGDSAGRNALTTAGFKNKGFIDGALDDE